MRIRCNSAIVDSIDLNSSESDVVVALGIALGFVDDDDDDDAAIDAHNDAMILVNNGSN
jgi:hypothetical protein